MTLESLVEDSHKGHGTKRFLLDVSISTAVSLGIFGPWELWKNGMVEALKSRAAMTGSNVLGLGRGFGIWREAYMEQVGVDASTSAFRRWFNEGSASFTYYTSYYVGLQYAFTDMSAMEISDNTVFSTVFCYLAGRAYGKIRDWWFTTWDEPPTISDENQRDLTPAARALLMPPREGITTLYDIAREGVREWRIAYKNGMTTD